MPECFGLLSFSRAELPGSCCRQQPRKKDCQVGGNRRVFCFLLREKAGLFWAPFSTNQIFFFFFFPFRKALCLRGFRQERNQSSRSEYLCIFAGCRFCLPSSACLAVYLPRLPGLLTPPKRCSPARESETPLQDGALWPKRKQGQKGNIPQSGASCVPSVSTAPLSVSGSHPACGVRSE